MPSCHLSFFLLSKVISSHFFFLFQFSIFIVTAGTKNDYQSQPHSAVLREGPSTQQHTYVAQLSHCDQCCVTDPPLPVSHTAGGGRVGRALCARYTRCRAAPRGGQVPLLYPGEGRGGHRKDTTGRCTRRTRLMRSHPRHAGS